MGSWASGIAFGDEDYATSRGDRGRYPKDGTAKHQRAYRFPHRQRFYTDQARPANSGRETDAITAEIEPRHRAERAPIFPGLSGRSSSKLSIREVTIHLFGRFKSG